MKQTINTRVVIAGIIAIALLDAWALWLGHNGALMLTALSLIALAIGVAIPKEKLKL